MTKVAPEEFITDLYMFIFFEGTRGRISYISNRYSKANSKYLKPYDQNKNQNILCTWTRIIYIVLQCLNFFQQMDSNG